MVNNVNVGIVYIMYKITKKDKSSILMEKEVLVIIYFIDFAKKLLSEKNTSSKGRNKSPDESKNKLFISHK